MPPHINLRGSPATLLGMWGVQIAVLAAVGFVYQLMLENLRHFMFSVPLWIAMTWLTYMASKRAMRYGGCQQRGIGTALGAFAGFILALLTHYYAFRLRLATAASMFGGLGDEVFADVTFWHYFEANLQRGFDGAGVSIVGGSVAAIWAVEALGLIGSSVIGSMHGSADVIDMLALERERREERLEAVRKKRPKGPRPVVEPTPEPAAASPKPAPPAKPKPAPPAKPKPAPPAKPKPAPPAKPKPEIAHSPAAPVSDPLAGMINAMVADVRKMGSQPDDEA